MNYCSIVDFLIRFCALPSQNSWKPSKFCVGVHVKVLRRSSRQKFCVRVHIKASSVSCHSKDVDSSDCDLCTLVNSELFELWTWVCLTSHLYPVGNCARLRLWPSFPVMVIPQLLWFFYYKTTRNKQITTCHNFSSVLINFNLFIL